MSDKSAALERLLKKLSGVRATLNKDERELLDEIVTGAKINLADEESEVSAHAWKAQSAAEMSIELAVESGRATAERVYKVTV
jgi:hypothetical protein